METQVAEQMRLPKSQFFADMGLLGGMSSIDVSAVEVSLIFAGIGRTLTVTRYSRGGLAVSTSRCTWAFDIAWEVVK